MVARQPLGWTCLDADVEGLPLFKRSEDPIYVATHDMDVLRCLDTALRRFDDMSPMEFDEHVNPAPSPGEFRSY